MPSRSGHIVNVSSLGGLVAFGATGYYHATKFAVEGLSESLAAELDSLRAGFDEWRDLTRGVDYPERP